MSRKSNERPCKSCGTMISMGEYAAGGTKCNSCCLQIVHSIFEHDEDDDSESEHKKLKKQIKVLEKTVVTLSERLHEQEKRTIGLEKMIQGFAMGMNVGRDNKSIVKT